MRGLYFVFLLLAVVGQSFLFAGTDLNQVVPVRGADVNRLAEVFIFTWVILTLLLVPSVRGWNRIYLLFLFAAGICQFCLLAGLDINALAGGQPPWGDWGIIARVVVLKFTLTTGVIVFRR